MKSNGIAIDMTKIDTNSELVQDFRVYRNHYITTFHRRWFKSFENVSMTIKQIGMPRIPLSQFMTVWMLLSVFSLEPAAHLVGQNSPAPSEEECPFEEGGEAYEEDLIVATGSRRFPNRIRNKTPHARQAPTRRGLLWVCQRQAAIGGHQLANGLRAPLFSWCVWQFCGT